MSVDDGESAVYGRMVWCPHEVAMQIRSGIRDLRWSD